METLRACGDVTPENKPRGSEIPGCNLDREDEEQEGEGDQKHGSEEQGLAGVWQHSPALGEGGRPSANPLQTIILAAEPTMLTKPQQLVPLSRHSILEPELQGPHPLLSTIYLPSTVRSPEGTMAHLFPSLVEACSPITSAGL